MQAIDSEAKCIQMAGNQVRVQWHLRPFFSEGESTIHRPSPDGFLEAGIAPVIIIVVAWLDGQHVRAVLIKETVVVLRIIVVETVFSINDFFPLRKQNS